MIKSSQPATLQHKETVQHLTLKIVQMLCKRSMCHDNSKMESPEVELFDEYTSKLKDCTYGSEEYNNFLKELKPALDHHYEVNRHHPEHFKNGCSDMNLIDVIEMLLDWKAATMRHNDGDINKSLEINKNRFKLDKVTLYDILKNTVFYFEIHNEW